MRMTPMPLDGASCCCSPSSPPSLLVAVAAWLGMGGGKTDAPAGGIDAGIVEPDAAEKVWTLRSEARLGGIETQLRQMQQEARRLGADNDRLRAKLESDARGCARGHRPPGGDDRRAAAPDAAARAAGQRAGWRIG